MPLPVIAALWYRPSSSTKNNAPDDNLRHLRTALAQFKKRIPEAAGPFGRDPLVLRGVFVAPEYYFAAPGMGTWNTVEENFQTRALEQLQKDEVVKELRAISHNCPSILI